MPLSRSMARETIWKVLDSADSTISTAQYTALDIAGTQAAVDALELKNDIISSKAANNTAVAKATASMPSTIKTIKVVDENGSILGYAPVYQNANLT